MKRFLNKKTSVVSIVFVIGCFICANRMIKNESNSAVLLENVEALAIEEGFDSECSGTEQYALVAVAAGKSQARIHYSDGFNGSNGLDMVFEIGYKQCIAEGYGTLNGKNFRWPTEIGNRNIVPCNGPQEHVMPIF